MSTTTIGTNTGNQAFFNTDRSQIFIWGNWSQDNSFVNNSGYNPMTLVAGTVMGRIFSTKALVPCNSTSTDGSQWPVGILADNMTVDAGDTVECSIYISGNVAKEKVVFWNNVDTLNTGFSNRTYLDLIHQTGLRLIPTTEMTNYDNPQ